MPHSGRKCWTLFCVEPSLTLNLPLIVAQKREPRASPIKIHKPGLICNHPGTMSPNPVISGNGNPSILTATPMDNTDDIQPIQSDKDDSKPQKPSSEVLRKAAVTTNKTATSAPTAEKPVATASHKKKDSDGSVASDEAVRSSSPDPESASNEARHSSSPDPEPASDEEQARMQQARDNKQSMACMGCIFSSREPTRMN